MSVATEQIPQRNPRGVAPTPVATALGWSPRKEGNFAGTAAVATCLQQSSKSGSLRRCNQLTETLADDFFNRRFQQTGKAPVTVQNGAVG